MNPTLRPDISLAEDWMFPVFLFCVATIAYVRYFFPSKLARLVQSEFNIRIFRQLMREEPRLSRENVLMNICFFLLMGLFCFLVCKVVSPQALSIGHFTAYVLFVLGVSMVYGLKTLAIGITRFIADGDFSMDEYRYSVFVSNRFFLLLLIPSTLLLAYGELQWKWAIIACVGAFAALLFLYRIARGAITAFQQGINVFDIFFYICTLEFLPILFGYKLLAT